MTDRQTPYHFSALLKDRCIINNRKISGQCWCKTIDDRSFVPRDFVNEVIKDKPWEYTDIYINILPHHNLLVCFKTQDLKDFAEGTTDIVPSENMAIEYCPFCGEKLPMDGFFGYKDEQIYSSDKGDGMEHNFTD